MITRDVIEKIQKLKERRYSQTKVAQELGISKSTVARYWHGEKQSTGSKAVPKRLGIDDVFVFTKCIHCGLAYPSPKFMPAWLCPGCKKQNSWKACWYPYDQKS